MQSVTQIKTPVDEQTVRSLRVGDAVTLAGTVFTARDRFHLHTAAGGDCRIDLQGGVLFHCGPIVTGKPGQWRLLAAGPTTSIREEPYMADVIKRFGIRIIIGKGGMGPDTLAACSRYGCVYIQATGGAAQYLRRCVRTVKTVHFIEKFGPAEAVWELVVNDFPGIVTMDSHGQSLYAQVESSACQRLQCLFETSKAP